MNRVVSFFLILSFGTFAVLPQTKQKGPSPFDSADPFKINTGSSFSASVPNRAGKNPNLPVAADKISQDYSEALEVIRRNYVDGGSLNYADVTKQALDSMLHVLDPHSNYFDPAEFQDLLTEQQSEYYGIGATIANYAKGGELNTYVIATFPDSPALKSGLKFGDRFVSVNGEPMAGKDSAYVRDKVRGKRGTLVRVVVERGATGKLETVDIRRNRVPQPSIPDAYILRDGIGYVDMSEGFNYTTSDELAVALAELHKQGMKSLVLDLRDNTGGIVDQSVKVAEKFLPAGSVILTQRGRYAVDSPTWRSFNQNPETLPLVVLVNDSTASASEIVSGALQDYDRAIIVGENTFGKGLVQNIIKLPQGAGLTLTAARYYTPSGRSIQRDYSKSTFYDYFNHKTAPASFEQGPVSKTITGRKVYGGGGIMPDEVIVAEQISETEAKLLDPVFFFSNELAAGHIKGLENYRIGNSVRFGSRIRPSDYPVGDDVVAAFIAFINQSPEWKALSPSADAAKSFLKTRIRYNLITAAFGTVSAKQVLVEDDKQVVRAVENLPRAGQLAQLASKALQKRK